MGPRGGQREKRRWTWGFSEGWDAGVEVGRDVRRGDGEVGGGGERGGGEEAHVVQFGLPPCRETV